jgi:hypothetical protein
MADATYIEEIAKIERTTLGYEDHGIFTCMLHLNFGGGGQGAGGYSLDGSVERDGERVRCGTAFGMEWVIRAMRAAGVREWSEVTGRTVLVLREPEDRRLIAGIKPLPTERGEPFIFADLVREVSA